MDPFENNKLEVEGLPQLGDQDFEMLPKRYFRLRMWTWGATSLISILLICSAIAWLAMEREAGISDFPMVLWIAMASWSIFLGLWGISEFHGFQMRGYAMRDRDLSYRAGFFFHAYTTVPFNRLQHSEISQGPVARLAKLCTLKIYTAGSSGANLSISGMDPVDAQRIRDYIDEHGGN